MFFSSPHFRTEAGCQHDSGRGRLDSSSNYKKTKRTQVLESRSKKSRLVTESGGLFVPGRQACCLHPVSLASLCAHDLRPLTWRAGEKHQHRILTPLGVPATHARNNRHQSQRRGCFLFFQGRGEGGGGGTGGRTDSEEEGGGRGGAGNDGRMGVRGTYSVCAEERGLVLQTHSSRQHDVILREHSHENTHYAALMCSERVNRI